MKLTGLKVLNTFVVTQELNGQPLFVNASMAFRRFKKKLTEETKHVEEERLEIAKRWCKKDDNGELLVEKNEYLFESDENRSEFEKELQMLFDGEVEIEFEPVKVSKLGDRVQISPDVLDYLIEVGVLIE